MSRRNPMIRTLVGSRRQQSKACRTKDTVILRLEALEDRNLPSDTPLSVI
jgi:hypothetical protein